MFVQVMQGKVGDRELLDRQMTAWNRDVRPGAIGFLGSTGGISPDGQVIVIARFADEESARRNSARPEQSAWWEATAPAFGGDVTFHDCSQIDEMFSGGSDKAGFVQVMQGRAADPEKMREMGRSMEDELRSQRPDLLGGIVAWHGDREFTQVNYFTSEADARKGEAEMDEAPGDWMALMDGPITFIDLPEPMLL